MADTVKGEVSETVETVNKVVSQATEDAVETVTKVAARATEDAVETVTEAAEDAVETVTEAAEDAEDTEFLADLVARLAAIETASALFNAELEKLWNEIQTLKSSIPPKSALERVEPPQEPPPEPPPVEPRRAASDVEENPERRTLLNLRRY